MAKTKTPTTRAEDLRRLANRARAPHQEDSIVVDTIELYDDVKEHFDSYADKIDEIDLDPLQELVGIVAELREAGAFEPAEAEALSDAVVALDAALNNVSFSGDTARGFVEAYDEAVQAWDDVVTVKEQDRYEGKGDDVADAWGTATATLEALADVADELGLG